MALKEDGVDLTCTVTQHLEPAMHRRVEVTISNDNQPVIPRSAVSSYTQ
ncbi:MULTISPECIES: hypothetical protein [Pseudomonas]|jgi:hypothetical protein|nr:MULTISPECIES: hypothetical protein [Pseudomonas]